MKKLLLIALVLHSVSGLTQDTITENVPIFKEIEGVEISPFLTVDTTYKGWFGIEPIYYFSYDWSFLLTNASTVESPFNKKGAKSDIKTNKMKVLFPGITVEGLAELSSVKDKALQKKYGVEFYRQGYEHTNTYKEDEKAYNQTIFAFLDEKYGQEWRFEMREDAIGFEIPDSLFRKKAEEVMNSLPEINVKDYVKRLPLKKPLFSTPLIPGIGISALLLSLTAIFFIFRRKKKSK